LERRDPYPDVTRQNLREEILRRLRVRATVVEREDLIHIVDVPSQPL
jgi:hypothetical protein